MWACGKQRVWWPLALDVRSGGLGRSPSVLLNAVHGPHRTRGTGLPADFQITLQGLLPHVTVRMVQMHADCLVANSFTANAEIHQTFTHLTILAAPFHPLIKSVDAKN